MIKLSTYFSLVLCGATNSNRRVMAIFGEDEPITAVMKASPQAFQLRVEETPADQMVKGIHDHFLAVAHFEKTPSERMFGVPFFLRVYKLYSYSFLIKYYKRRSFLVKLIDVFLRCPRANRSWMFARDSGNDWI